MTKDLQDAQASIIGAIKNVAQSGTERGEYLTALVASLAALQELEFDRITFHQSQDEQYTGTTKSTPTYH